VQGREIWPDGISFYFVKYGSKLWSIGLSLFIPFISSRGHSFTVGPFLKFSLWSKRYSSCHFLVCLSCFVVGLSKEGKTRKNHVSLTLYHVIQFLFP